MKKTQEKNNTLKNTVICIIDRRGRVIWSSDDPMDERKMAGSVIMDMLPESERAVLREALQVCIVENKTAYYILHGPPSPGMIAGPDIKWRVTLIPYESDGTAAAVAICVVLPSNYAEFNDDDKNVLRYLSKDMTLKDIAASCNRSESAVDAKIRILKDKLNVSNLAGLVGAALVNHVI